MNNINNFQIFGLRHSILAMKNSYKLGTNPNDYNKLEDKDFNLALKLGSVSVGAGHDSYLKGIRVLFDFRTTQYLDHQMQRYRFFDIVSSQSIMHKIKGICEDSVKLDFNIFKKNYFNEELQMDDIIIKNLINELQRAQRENKSIDYIRSIIPEGTMLWKTISTNYLQLKTIYYQRRYHKLNEWQEFCKYLEKLPLLKNILLNINLTEDDLEILRNINDYLEFNIC